MRQIRVAELKDSLSRVLRSVEEGETVEVLDRTRPIARLTPIKEPITRQTKSVTIIPAKRPFAEIRDHVYQGLGLDVDVDELLAEERAEPDWFSSR